MLCLCLNSFILHVVSCVKKIVWAILYDGQCTCTYIYFCRNTVYCQRTTNTRTTFLFSLILNLLFYNASNRRVKFIVHVRMYLVQFYTRFKAWMGMHTCSPKTRERWRSLTGLSPSSYSVTRWRSHCEVRAKLTVYRSTLILVMSQHFWKRKTFLLRMLKSCNLQAILCDSASTRNWKLSWSWLSTVWNLLYRPHTI